MSPMTFFADSAGATGGSVPFQRTVDPDKLGMFLNLEQSELLRLQRYREHWRFYYNKHWQFVREDGDPLVTFNYFKKVIDKSAAFLCSKGFVIKSPEALEHLTAPFLEEVWKYNKRDQLLWDTSIMGGVTGDAFLLVTYKEPTPLERRIYPFAKGRIIINLLGSEQVFPDWNPLNKSEMRSVRIETLFYDSRPTNDIGADDQSSEGRQLNIRRYTQIITPDTITEHLQGEEPTVRPNILGEIPIVHIKNLPAPNEPYGTPDGLEIMDVNREINEKATDLSDVVNYHAAPITVITGAKAKNLERGPRQIWSGLPKEARVQNLRLEGDLNASHKYVEMVKEVLLDLSDTPEGSLGKMQTISNTAGVALHLQFGPLMEKTVKKRAQYGPGFEKVNYFILRIAHVQGLINLPFDLDKKSRGKIAMVEETAKDELTGEPLPTGATTLVPRSFLMDPETLQFQKPEEVRLKYVRQYSFGNEVREDPFWRILAESRMISKSFWDPEPETTIDDEAARMHDERQAALTANHTPPVMPGEPVPVMPEAPPPPMAQPVKMSADQIVVPEEPEEVTIVVPFYDPKTGELVEERRVTRTLVPTGVLNPEYLNPYETSVQFNDPLPKDLQLQAQLYQTYQAMGIVSRRWIQNHIPDVAPYIEEIERQLEQEKSATPLPAETGGMMDFGGSEMQRDNAATSEPPSGGLQALDKGSEERGGNTGRM